MIRQPKQWLISAGLEVLLALAGGWVAGHDSVPPGMECIATGQNQWHGHPTQNVVIQADMAEPRRPTIHSLGDWRDYHPVSFYFVRIRGQAPGNAQWAQHLTMRCAPGFRLGVVPNDHGSFKFAGTTPPSAHFSGLYTVVVVADRGQYVLWSMPFGHAYPTLWGWPSIWSRIRQWLDG